MTRNFIITGMSRTRTAWLANLFTTGKAFCYHEWFGKNKLTERNIYRDFKNHEYQYIGNSDSSWGLRIEIIHKYFKDVPIVIIERNIDEVTRSVEKAFSDAHKYPLKEAHLALQKSLCILKQNFNCLSVDFADLEKNKVIEKIWNHCVPFIEIDKKRLDMLQNMRIIVKQEKLEDIQCH